MHNSVYMFHNGLTKNNKFMCIHNFILNGVLFFYFVKINRTPETMIVIRGLHNYQVTRSITKNKINVVLTWKQGFWKKSIAFN